MNNDDLAIEKEAFHTFVTEPLTTALQNALENGMSATYLHGQLGLAIERAADSHIQNLSKQIAGH